MIYYAPVFITHWIFTLLAIVTGDYIKTVHYSAAEQMNALTASLRFTMTPYS